MKTLVLGVGNPLLKDDGIGIHVVRELEKEVDGADFKEASVSGLELVEMLRGYERAIIVDAVKTRDGVPGKIYKLTPNDIPTMHGISPHDVDFRTAIEFGEKFIGEMPERIEIYGIEVENVTEFGEGLSRDLKKSLPAIIKEIKHSIEDGS